MADTPKKPRSRKKPTVKKTKDSLRQRNAKAATKKDKPKRVRKAAVTATKPISKAANAVTAEYHVLPRHDDADKHGFFTKSRKLTPSYVRKSLAELKYVTWPGRSETWKLVFAVFVFAIFIGLFIAVLDFGLQKAFREVIL